MCSTTFRWYRDCNLLEKAYRHADLSTVLHFSQNNWLPIHYKTELPHCHPQTTQATCTLARWHHTTPSFDLPHVTCVHHSCRPQWHLSVWHLVCFANRTHSNHSMTHTARRVTAGSLHQTSVVIRWAAWLHHGLLSNHFSDIHSCW